MPDNSHSLPHIRHIQTWFCGSRDMGAPVWVDEGGDGIDVYLDRSWDDGLSQWSVNGSYRPSGKTGRHACRSLVVRRWWHHIKKPCTILQWLVMSSTTPNMFDRAGSPFQTLPIDLQATSFQLSGHICQLTDTLLFKTSTTPLNPGFRLVLSLSSSSTSPNTRPVSDTSRDISAQYVKAVPSAGLVVTAEKLESGFRGRDDAVPLITYFSSGHRAQTTNDELKHSQLSITHECKSTRRALPSP